MKMTITADIDINQDLYNDLHAAFVSFRVQNSKAREEREYWDEIIDDLENDRASDSLKHEVAAWLLFRAGFESEGEDFGNWRDRSND